MGTRIGERDLVPIKVSARITLQGSFAHPDTSLRATVRWGALLRNRAAVYLRKHPERRAAAVMSFAPAIPAARSRRTLPLTNGAQASFDYAHRRLRADALRSGCLRLLCALPRTRHFCPAFPLKAVRDSE